MWRGKWRNSHWVQTRWVMVIGRMLKSGSMQGICWRIELCRKKEQTSGGEPSHPLLLLEDIRLSDVLLTDWFTVHVAKTVACLRWTRISGRECFSTWSMCRCRNKVNIANRGLAKTSRITSKIISLVTEMRLVTYLHIDPRGNGIDGPQD